MALPTPSTPGFGSFRGRTACTCLIAWLPVFETELQRRGLLTGALPIFQLTGSASASGNTHSQGGAFDITDLAGEIDLQVARQMGADATWSRDAGFSVKHVHGVLRGCPHNVPARYQIDAVDDDFNGLGHLGRGGKDDGPRPLSGRTWREGIAWAKEQGDDMPAPKDWTAADWAAFNEHASPALAEALLDGQTVELKKRDGTSKPITIRSAVQRILNPDE